MVQIVEEESVEDNATKATSLLGLLRLVKSNGDSRSLHLHLEITLANSRRFCLGEVMNVAVRNNGCINIQCFGLHAFRNLYPHCVSCSRLLRNPGPSLLPWRYAASSVQRTSTLGTLSTLADLFEQGRRSLARLFQQILESFHDAGRPRSNSVGRAVVDGKHHSLIFIVVHAQNDDLQTIYIRYGSDVVCNRGLKLAYASGVWLPYGIDRCITDLGSGCAARQWRHRRCWP